MPIKSYRPTTYGRRGASVDSFADVTKKSPEKSLQGLRLVWERNRGGSDG